MDAQDDRMYYFATSYKDRLDKMSSRNKVGINIETEIILSENPFDA